MNYKLNCWEYMSCGRQPGGNKADELGICPVTVDARANRINDGINGGRACWAITGTLCGGEKQGNYTQKLRSCLQCNFFSEVRKQQGAQFVNSREILKHIQSAA